MSRGPDGSRRGRGARALAAALILAAGVAAQQGDRAGETQPYLPPELMVPPAPVLSPAEALNSFTVADGWRVELVAAEPLVVDPVMVTFDGDGRLWVVEMRGYMPDADGHDEDAPVGEIAVLHDDDGDGVMDRRVTFLDGLVLPRAVAPTRGGALVLAPPDLLFCRDTDGDGRADERTVIDTGFGGIHSPEHAPNGLLPTLDNAFRLANDSRQYRWGSPVDGEPPRWYAEATGGGGQWGITQDDVGRILYDTNSDPLRGDLLPSVYNRRNPNHGNLWGQNVRIAHDMRVWPGRMTPGVNRGYRSETLNDAYELVRFTAACSPWVLRGQGLPPELRGSVAVCEPSANLLKLYDVHEQPDGSLEATPTYPDGRELLVSTDERFRPVQLAGGPDGALYVVDLYRGILQHKIFMTSFLRRQVEERGLAEPVGLGRIYRLAHEGTPAWEPPRMSQLELRELVPLIDHDGGWWRDRAQQELIEREQRVQERRRENQQGDSIHPAPMAWVHARRKAGPLGRLHALWMMHGAGYGGDTLVHDGLADADARVRMAAMRVAEPLLASHAELREALAARSLVSAATTPLEATQALISLGAAGPLAWAPLARALSVDASTAARRSAVLSGLRGHELDMLLGLLGVHARPDAGVAWSLGGRPAGGWPEPWVEPAPGRDVVLRLLARAITREGSTSRLAELLDRVAPTQTGDPWRELALLDGVLDGLGTDGRGDVRRRSLHARPARHHVLRAAAGLAPWPNAAGGFGDEAPAWASPGDRDEVAAAATAALGDAQRARFARLDSALWWPGRSDLPDVPEVRPLSADEQAAFERGRATFELACAQCHQPSGLGEPGKAPPLRDSPWVLGDPERLGGIVLHGLVGEITFGSRTWDLEMPAFPADDVMLADLLTYLRREWGHDAEPVTPALMAEVRADTAERDGPFQVSELLGHDGQP